MRSKFRKQNGRREKNTKEQKQFMRITHRCHLVFFFFLLDSHNKIAYYLKYIFLYRIAWNVFLKKSFLINIDLTKTNQAVFMESHNIRFTRSQNTSNSNDHTSKSKTHTSISSWRIVLCLFFLWQARIKSSLASWIINFEKCISWKIVIHLFRPSVWRFEKQKPRQNIYKILK